MPLLNHQTAKSVLPQDLQEQHLVMGYPSYYHHSPDNEFHDIQYVIAHFRVSQLLKVIHSDPPYTLSTDLNYPTLV